jgi:hypothetical protein
MEKRRSTLLNPISKRTETNVIIMSDAEKYARMV